jgi:hypothetical protein
MPFHSPMQDRYGLPLTTSSTLAAERFIEDIDLLLEQHFGPEDQCTRLHKACTIRYRYCSPNSDTNPCHHNHIFVMPARIVYRPSALLYHS